MTSQGGKGSSAPVHDGPVRFYSAACVFRDA